MIRFSVTLFVAIILATSCAVTIDRESSDEKENALGNHWLKPAPEDIWPGIPRFQKVKFFEVSASKLDTAEYWLNEVLYLYSDSETIEYFGRPEFKCPDLTNAYLLRANYLNGGTGHFDVSITGTIVVVEHHSLGGGIKMYQSSLIACLPTEPTNVYSWVSSDI